MVALKGKVAVVTGASRGMGKGIALGLGDAGATVMSNSESPQFIGRVIAALANDRNIRNIMKKSGKVLVAAQEAL